jgi:hypothetical protein
MLAQTIEYNTIMRAVFFVLLYFVVSAGAIFINHKTKEKYHNIIGALIIVFSLIYFRFLSLFFGF